MNDAARPLAAEYFDGTSAKAHAVEVRVDGDHLSVAGIPGGPYRVALNAVQWPERQRHGARTAVLPGNAALHFPDVAGFDAWVRQVELPESWVVKAQQSWRWTAAATLLLVVLCASLYQWGLPLAARGALAFVPGTIDRDIGDLAMRSIRNDGWIEPSELPDRQQQSLRAAWERATARAGHTGSPIEILFHKGTIGPNAFALPGGKVILTDEMVALVDGREDILIGILAHEAGHVHHRHGMRTLAQSTLFGALTTVLYGDFSGLLAAAPAVLGHLGYSRGFEREADADAIALLKANDISPAVMATLFERIRERQRKSGMPRLPIALASHPPDDERIARFRDAAASP